MTAASHAEVVWAERIKAALSRGDRDAYDRAKSQQAQLAALQRARAALGVGAGVGAASGSSAALSRVLNESILTLAAGAVSQPCEDVVAPLHGSARVGVSALMRMYVDADRRLGNDAPAPSGVGESLALEVAKGLYGGPCIPNERASDVCAGPIAGLVAALGVGSAPAAAVSHAYPRSALEAAAASSKALAAFTEELDPPPDLVQIALDIDIARGMCAAAGDGEEGGSSGFGGVGGLSAERSRHGSLPTGGGVEGSSLGQPAEIFIRIWDAVGHTFLSEDVLVDIGADGRAITPGAVSGGKAWSQAVFFNVPRALVAAGKCVLVLRLFRRGRLKAGGGVEGDGGGEGGASGNSSKSGVGQLTGILARFLQGSSTPVDHDSATYLRPHGVAILPVPPALCILADGTPHAPDSVSFMRPSRNDDSRFFGFHRVLLEELQPMHASSPSLSQPLSGETSSSSSRSGGGEGGGNVGGNVSSDERGGSKASGAGSGAPKQIQQLLVGGAAQAAMAAAGTLGDEGSSSLAVRAHRLAPFPVVLRCFSTLPLPLLLDPRLGCALSATARLGACAMPCVWTWRPPQAPTTASSAVPLGSTSGGTSTAGSVAGAGSVVITSPSAQRRPTATVPSISSPLASPSPSRVAAKSAVAANEPPSGGSKRSVIADGALRGGEGGSMSGGEAAASAAGVVSAGGCGPSMCLSSLLPDGTLALESAACSGIDVVSANAILSSALAPRPLPPDASPAAMAAAAAAASTLSPISRLVHRDTLFVTIKRGLFAQDQKVTPRNVQVRASVVLDDGTRLACLLQPVAAGIKAADSSPFSSVSSSDSSLFAAHATAMPRYSTEWRSAVYYHCNSPQFDHTIGVCIPDALITARAHLLFSFWHASNTADKTQAFAFAFLPFADEAGVILNNGLHTLPCYKPVGQSVEESLAASTSLSSVAPPAVDGTHSTSSSMSALIPTMPSPWYLVAPVVSLEGIPLVPPAPLPLHGTENSPIAPITAAFRDTTMSSSTAGGGGMQQQQRLLPRLSLVYAASARSRHLPPSAIPQTLVSVDATATAAAAAAAAVATTSASPSSAHGHSVGGKSTSVPSAIAQAFWGHPLLQQQHGHSAPVIQRSSPRHVRDMFGALILLENDAAVSSTHAGARAVGSTVTWADTAPQRRRLLQRQWRERTFGGGSGEGSGAEARDREDAALRAMSSGSASGGGAAAAAVAARRGGGAGVGGDISPLHFLVDALELRPRDSFEVETTLISVSKTSLPEVNVLMFWQQFVRLQPHALLAALTALVNVPTSKHTLFLREAPLIIQNTCELLSFLATSPLLSHVGSSSSSNSSEMAAASFPLREDGGRSLAEYQAFQTASARENWSSSLLAAAFHLLVASLDALHPQALAPPSPLVSSSGMGNDQEKSGSESSTQQPSRVTCLPNPSLLQSYAGSHLLNALFAGSLLCPELHCALLPLLSGFALAVSSSTTSTEAFSGGSDSFVSIFLHSSPHSNPSLTVLPPSVIFSSIAVHTVWRQWDALVRLAALSASQAHAISRETGGVDAAAAFSATMRSHFTNLLSTVTGCIALDTPQQPQPQQQQHSSSTTTRSAWWDAAPWALSARVCILRRLPSVLETLHPWVGAVKMLHWLRIALSAAPLRHWSLVRASPSVHDAPGSMRLATLLLLRSAFKGGLVDAGANACPTGEGGSGDDGSMPTSSEHLLFVQAAVHTLVVQFNESSVQRHLCVRIASALLSSFERRKYHSKGGAPSALLTLEAAVCANLLHELSLAVTSIIQGEPARGDVPSAPSWLADPMRARGKEAVEADADEDESSNTMSGPSQPPHITRLLRRIATLASAPLWEMSPSTAAAAASPTGASPSARPLSMALILRGAANPMNSLSPTEALAVRAERDCCALPAAVFSEVYGQRALTLPLCCHSCHSAKSSVGGEDSSSAAAHGGCVPRVGGGGEDSSTWLTLVVTTWMSLAWSVLNDDDALVLIATVSPLSHFVNAVAAAPSASADRQCKARRLELVTSTLQAGLALLGSAAFPPTWLDPHQQLHSAILRLYAACGSYLASVHRGSPGLDDLPAVHRYLSTALEAAATGGAGGVLLQQSRAAAAAAGTSSSRDAKTSWAAALPAWELFTELTIAFLTSPWFAPEALSGSIPRRARVLELYGDRRGTICSLFRSAWGGDLTAVTPTTTAAAFAAPPDLIVTAPETFFDVSGATLRAVLREGKSKSGNSVGGGLCASLRVALAPLLVPALLDLTHCINTDVSSLARDAYLDLVAGELHLATQTAEFHLATQAAAAGSKWSSISSVKSPSTPNVTSSGARGWSSSSNSANGVTAPKRLTATTPTAATAALSPTPGAFAMLGDDDDRFNGAINTNSSWVALSPSSRRMTALSSFSPPSFDATSASISTAAGGGVVTNHHSSSHVLVTVESIGLPELERLTLDALDVIVANKGPSYVIPLPLPAMEGGHAAEGVGLASSSRSTNGGVRSMHVSYIPPPDNLLMSLFAPSAQKEEHLSETAATAHTTSGILSHPVVRRFLLEARDLYSLLASLSAFPKTPEFEDERTLAACGLLMYLKRMQRRDLHSRYVAFLVALHTGCGNKAEAALSFLMHADILAWEAVGGGGGGGAKEDGPPPALPPVFDGDGRLLFSAQTPAARLEVVLSGALSGLITAGCWEEALRVSEVLAARYEIVTAEYAKLGALLRTQAGLYESIATSARVFCAYFCARFSHSKAFPPSVRGRTFIMRGRMGEWIGDFEGNMLRKWKGAVKVPLQLEGPHLAILTGSGSAATASAPSPALHGVEGGGVVSSGRPPASPPLRSGWGGIGAAATSSTKIPLPPPLLLEPPSLDESTTSSSSSAAFWGMSSSVPAADAMLLLQRNASPLGSDGNASDLLSASAPLHCDSLELAVTHRASDWSNESDAFSNNNGGLSAFATGVDGVTPAAVAAAASSAISDHPGTISTASSSPKVGMEIGFSSVSVVPFIPSHPVDSALALLMPHARPSSSARSAGGALLVGSPSTATGALGGSVRGAASSASSKPLSPSSSSSSGSGGGSVSGIAPAATAGGDRGDTHFSRPPPPAFAVLPPPSSAPPLPPPPYVTSPIVLAFRKAASVIASQPSSPTSASSSPPPSSAAAAASSSSSSSSILPPPNVPPHGGSTTSPSSHAITSPSSAAALVSGVRPSPTAAAWGALPSLIRQGREHTGARVFLHQKPLRIRGDRSGNDILDTWVIRTYLSTADAFPCVLRTSPVLQSVPFLLNPVEVAILGLADKTGTLLEQMASAEAGADRAAPQAFSQTLAGCVDAAVSGGVTNYAPLFTGAFRESHPEIAEDLAAGGDAGGGAKAALISGALAAALGAHACVLARGIGVHAVKCQPDMLPLHQHLVERFAVLQKLLREWGVDA